VVCHLLSRLQTMRSTSEGHNAPPVPTGRREFLGILILSLLPARVSRVRPGVTAASADVRIAALVARHSAAPRTMHSVEWGLRFGFDEVRKTGSLLGAAVSARTKVALSPAQANHMIRSAVVEQPAFMIVAADMATVRAAAQGVRQETVVFNILASDDALRDSCQRNLFHICRGDTAKLAVDAETKRRGETLMWHHALERYGARQLNDRYSAFAKRPMDSDSWCAWLATKIAFESATRELNSAKRASWLVSANARFDGHKGAPLTFVSSTHQLQQPLVVSHAGAQRETDLSIVNPSPAQSRQSGTCG
jgi:hypothetical protein